MRFFLSLQGIFAQEFKVDANSKLSVSGTSTLHDWECDVTPKAISGNLIAVIEEGTLKAVKDFKFSFPVKAIKSGKSGMDKKTYDALKEEKFPSISFTYQNVSITGNEALFEGNMKIAGVTKTFNAPVKVTYQNGSLWLEGEQSFELADFKIDPPTAVFGTIKTGKTVTIHYHINLIHQ